jgi:hypothetical protein
MKRLICLLPLGFLFQCAGNSPTAVDVLEPRPYFMSDAPGSLDEVRVPVAQSRILEVRWGKPELSVLSDGSYLLKYQQDESGFERLLVIGSPAIFGTAASPPSYMEQIYDEEAREPKLVEQQPEWVVGNALGRSVRYAMSSAGSGADPQEFATETFRASAPDGRSGSYRIFASSNIGQSTAASYLATVTWAP